MDIHVARRLINNLKDLPIQHNQKSWLKNGGHIFIVSETQRWSCATSGCAAGFLFLSEAPNGSIFDVAKERIFSSKAERDKYDYLSYTGETIVGWGARILQITPDEAHDLFYDFSDTEGIIRKIEELIKKYETSA